MSFELNPEKWAKEIKDLRVIISDKIKEMEMEKQDPSKKDETKEKGFSQYGNETFVEHDGRLISSKKLQPFSVLRKPDEMQDDPFVTMIKERLSRLLRS